MECFFPSETKNYVEFMWWDSTAVMKKEIGNDLTTIQLDEILIATDTIKSEENPEYIIVIQ